MKKVLVTGAAGFVGSHLCDHFLSKGCSVIGLDNLSTGNLSNLETAFSSEHFQFFKTDLFLDNEYSNYFQDTDLVCHMAANADIRDGLNETSRDINQNILVTHNILEAMRKSGVKRIIFASSAAALGEPEVFPTPETCEIPLQTSLYGASKMACEGLISSYCVGFGFEAYIYRFVSLLGPRYPHGHVIDFFKQLAKNPNKLLVLGDGSQRKSYLHIKDCIKAISLMEDERTARDSQSNCQIYHLGNTDHITVKKSIKYICSTLGVNPKIEFTGGKRGWVGDSPFVFLDVTKAKSVGWAPEWSIENSIIDTVNWLQNQLTALDPKSDEHQ